MDHITPEFDQFWAAYPNRKGKGDARKAWAAAARQTPDLLTRCLTALAWQRHQKSWTKDDGDYIPYPATWLRAERWEDENPQAARQAEQAARAAIDAAANEAYKAQRRQVEAEQEARWKAEMGIK